MGILDGQVAKQTLLSALADRFIDARRLLHIAAIIFVISILLTPIIIYFNFAYFTAAVGPWWLDVVTGLNILAFLLSGLAILLLGLARLMADHKD
jgi:hypothetical protein